MSATKMKQSGAETGGRARRRERGLALMELMLFTVPLCVLSIVFASAIGATATAKNKSMWKASVKAQKATTQPCGGAPAIGPVGPKATGDLQKFVQGGVKAKEPVGIELALTHILNTDSKTEEQREQVAEIHFDKAADKMFPGRTKEAKNSATFLCNEPDNGDSRRNTLKFPLIGLAEKTAQELY